MQILVIIAVLVTVFVIYKVLTSGGSDPIEEYKKRKKNPAKPLKYMVQPKLSSAQTFSFYAGVLEEKFVFYRNLPDEMKKAFLQRLDIFIRTHKFKPAQMPEVTLEMKTMISATAIQLSFGLRDFLARGIRGFVVYPSIYYLEQARSHAKGHYSKNGVVYLAYNHFEKGHADSEDGVNLGIHEMAHALHHLYERSMGYWFFFNDLVREWFKDAAEGKHIQRPGEVDGFLRKYAATNVQEFFAVCVENYFERPAELHERLPDIYKHLCFILNQNIIGIPLKPEIEVEHNAKDKMIFKENVNVFGSIFIVLIGVILFTVISLASGEVSPFLVVISLMFGGGFIANISATKQIEFYNDYILVRSILNKSNYKLVPVKMLLYVAHYKKVKSHGSSNSASNVISFVHYNRGVRELADVISPSKKFLANVQQYCHKKGLKFIDKVGC